MLDQRPNIPVDDTFSGGANSNMVADPVQVFMETFRRDNAPYQLLQKCLRSGLIWPSNSPESTLEAPLPTFQSQNPQRAFSGPMRSGSGRVWRQRLLITEMCPESSGESVNKLAYNSDGFECFLSTIKLIVLQFVTQHHILPTH